MRKPETNDEKPVAAEDLRSQGDGPSRALDQVAEAVVVLDQASRITYVNSAFKHLLGYSTEDVLGKPLSILSVPGQADSLQPEGVARRVRESGRWHGEVHRRAKDGSAIPFQLTVSAIRDEQGGITGYVGTYLDLRAGATYRTAVQVVGRTFLRHDHAGRPYRQGALCELLGAASAWTHTGSIAGESPV